MTWRISNWWKRWLPTPTSSCSVEVAAAVMLTEQVPAFSAVTTPDASTEHTAGEALL